ncbi:unnamed protein product, partial [Brenthis ino]
MLVKIAHMYPDVDNLRCKDLTLTMECIIPRRPKRNLPTLPEDKEYTIEFKTKLVGKKRRQRRQLRLPVLQESDEH